MISTRQQPGSDWQPSRPSSAGRATFSIRPLGPEDRARYAKFLQALEAEDLRQRTLGGSVRPAASRIDELIRPDGVTSLALAAVESASGAILGVVRAAVHAAEAEFAIIVHSRCQGRGIGHALLRALLERLRERAVERALAPF